MKVEAAKKSGLWNSDGRVGIDINMPKEFAGALKKNKKAEAFFEQLAPTYQKHYIGWVSTAKRKETREKRISESIGLLEQGKRLGGKLAVKGRKT